ncbi:NUDIX hydrolase domain-like protein [Gymnopilus junonius]|uniref:NUDIX hydrolase domain-like protein n=1 Tax=Gymnopilus junonius TaxID=109634 RepID=A0A9P5TKR4_GYMJU|nr:NUDIX hydrolase domain-like protein [Gymnopilus junonius]
MAAPRYPTQQFLAGKFVISAGSVLFRRNSSNKNFEICILHHPTGNQWLLPKGRKDQGETIEHAAIRETYEETGYPCVLWPQSMPTRAPTPGVSDVHFSQVVDGLVEPIAVTMRELQESKTKIIFWYISVVEEGVKKVEGSQMENENFESVFLEAEAALRRLTFQSDKDVVKQAIDIVMGRIEKTTET